MSALRDKLMEAYDVRPSTADLMMDILDVVNKIANNEKEAQTEIIRCKYCRHYIPEFHQCGRQVCSVMYEDDSCSYGDRGEEDE